MSKLIGIFSLSIVLLACSNNNNSVAQETTTIEKTKEITPDKLALIKKITKGMKTTDSGLQYKITHKGKGAKPKKGDVVKVHYTGTLVDGTKFDSSLDRGEPLPLKLGVGMVIKGWDEGIALLNVGSKATFFIPGDLAYGVKGSGKLIGPNEPLVFTVELTDIVDIGPFDITGKKENVTASGIKYYIIKETEGTLPNPGQKVNVHYSGYLMDGKPFDSSWNRMRPFSFNLGSGVIAGWSEGVGLMKVGEKTRFIIPPNLAYGKAGAGNGLIPPNATLVFDIELLSVQ